MTYRITYKWLKCANDGFCFFPHTLARKKHHQLLEQVWRVDPDLLAVANFHQPSQQQKNMDFPLGK